MIFVRSRITRLLLSGLIATLAITPTISHAHGFGYSYRFHGRGFGAPVMGVPVIGAPVTGAAVQMITGTSTGLLPTALTTPLVQMTTGTSTGALLPTALAPAGVTGFTSNVLMPSSVLVYTYAFVGPNTAQPILGSGGTPSNTPGALLPSAVSPAATGTDILAEYNAFVASENTTSPAGVSLHPSDVTQFATSFASLSNAVGGANRLGSIGRFLRTKITDPNFRDKAFRLFGSFLGVALPQFQPIIDAFLGQLGQGTGGPPPPVPPINPPVNPNGELRVRVTFDNAPPTQVNPPLVDTIEALAKAMGATVVSKDASGITIKKPDGSTVKFGPDGKVIPPTQ